MERPRFRRILAPLIALGLVAPTVTYAPAVTGSQVLQGQRSGKDQAAPPVTQAPSPLIALDSHAFFGASSRHPIWLGIAKRGRNGGTRSRWNYRR